MTDEPEWGILRAAYNKWHRWPKWIRHLFPVPGILRNAPPAEMVHMKKIRLDREAAIREITGIHSCITGRGDKS